MGTVIDGKVQLSAAGQIVHNEWLGLPNRFPMITLDALVVMPNHLHGILTIEPVGAAFMTPSGTTPSVTKAGPKGNATKLGEMIRAFKAVSTRRILTNGLIEFAWQRDFYDRIIRNAQKLHRV